jgi:hypothetical protein
VVQRFVVQPRRLRSFLVRIGALALDLEASDLQILFRKLLQ